MVSVSSSGASMTYVVKGDPDVWLFRKRETSEAFLPAGLRDLDPAEVNFGNCLQLVGVRLSRDPVSLTLKLHWRALAVRPRRLRCFAHVLAGERQISALDHKILRHGPAMDEWDVGDEGYERRRLWLSTGPEPLRVRLGVYDPRINVRAPVLASTLSVTDEASAVWLQPDVATSASDYAIKFEPAPLVPSHVVFERGLELAAYSIVRHRDLVWLRLKWNVYRNASLPVRFFGHLVRDQGHETPTLLQFDQDFASERQGPVTAVEQNIVRALPPSAAAGSVLRAGVFRTSSLYRLKIKSAALPFDAERCCFYLPFGNAGIATAGSLRVG